MIDDLFEIKLVMLEEFENQVDMIMNSYFEKKIDLNDCLNNIQILKNIWRSARVDLKNHGDNNSNSIEFLEYGKYVDLSYPKWFEDETGKGSKVEFNDKIVQLIFRHINDGKLVLSFKGVDYRDLNKERVPIYVNYKKIIINNAVIFEGEKLSWHNMPYKYVKECVNSEMIHLRIEFQSIYDYFPYISSSFDNVSNESDLNVSYELLKKFFEINKRNLEELCEKI